MGVYAIMADTAVLAWFGSALINVDFAVFSFESSWAIASVIIDQISAQTAILTWFWFALVNVSFAIVSGESSGACACV
jgi:hypothetical protein